MQKRNFLPLLIVTCLFFTSSISAFALGEMGNTTKDVDGYVWMNSSDQEKKSFLFGAGSAVVLEYQLRIKKSETPSMFIEGWIKVLQDTSWTSLADNIDRYYTTNPDKMNRHVFDVIWHEMIKPNLKNS